MSCYCGDCPKCNMEFPHYWSDEDFKREYGPDYDPRPHLKKEKK